MTLWDVAIEYLHKLDPILADMSRSGANIDLKAQETLRAKVEIEIAETLDGCQKCIPPGLFPTRVWKRIPTDRLTQEIQVPGKVKICMTCWNEVKSKTVHQKGRKNPCKGALMELRDGLVPAFVEVLPFNPLSTKQLMAYCRHFKHPVGEHIKTKNPTVNVRHLAKLNKKYGVKHPLYAETLKIRSLQKIESTFIFKTDENGIASGVFKHTPETLRLAMAGHNWQQVPHRGTALYADEIRRTVIPHRGHVFVQGDSAGIEAVNVAYFAGDKDYMEIAKRGPHSYLTCLEFGLPFTDENANLVKTDAKYKSAYSRNKTVIHLSGFGGGPSMIHHQFPDVFPTVKLAEAAQQKFFTACPAVPKWWKQTRELAQRQGYLTNPWGLRNYYYNVFRRDPDDPNKLILGEESKEVIAFLPQSSAAMFMRENLRILGGTWARPFMPIIGSIHDSLCLDVPEGRKSESIELLASVLSRPIIQMQSLRVGCDIETGPNWADLEKVKSVRF